MSLIDLLIESVSSGRKKKIKEKIAQILFDSSYEYYDEIIDGIRMSKKIYPDNEDMTENIHVDRGISIVDKLFDTVTAIDPTNSGKYMNWIVDKYLKKYIENGAFEINKIKSEIDIIDFNNILSGQIMGAGYRKSNYIEDIEKMHDYLSLYHKYKNKNLIPNEYKDINRIDGGLGGDVKDKLYSIIKPIYDDENKFKGDVFELIEDELIEDEDYIDYGVYDGFHIFTPLTVKAQSYMGVDTEWCTTYGKHCLNPEYHDRSPNKYDNLFILINVNDQKEKYQFHFETNQFMDRDDKPINWDVFNDAPEIINFFGYLLVRYIHNRSEYNYQDLKFNDVSNTFEFRSTTGFPLIVINNFLYINDFNHDELDNIIGLWKRGDYGFRNELKNLVSGVIEEEINIHQGHNGTFFEVSHTFIIGVIKYIRDGDGDIRRILINWDDFSKESIKKIEQR